MPKLASIWDCSKMNTGTDEDGKKFWSCGWCKMTRKGDSGTRALAHVLCRKTMHGNSINVANCSVALNGGMDNVSRMKYENLYNMLTSRKGNKREYKEALMAKISGDIDEGARNMKIRKLNGAATDASNATAGSKMFPNYNSENNTFEPESNNSSGANSNSNGTSTKETSKETSGDSNPSNKENLNFATSQRVLSSKHGSLTTHQQHFDHATGDLYSPSHEEKLDYACAKFIFCDGPPFSTSESPHFKSIIQYAKHVWTSYCPPSRNTISTTFLD